MLGRMLLVVLALASFTAPASAKVVVGQKAPDFSLATLKGGKASLSSLKGKVVLLDFWAQWCEPCKKELPQLEKIAKEMAGKDVVILTVNIDKQKDNAARMAKQLGLSVEVALDPTGAVAGTYDLPKMPTSYLIDKKGVVRFVHEGFEGGGDVERFRKELAELSQ